MSVNEYRVYTVFETNLGIPIRYIIQHPPPSRYHGRHQHGVHRLIVQRPQVDPGPALLPVGAVLARAAAGAGEAAVAVETAGA